MIKQWQTTVTEIKKYHDDKQMEFSSGTRAGKTGWSIRDTAKQLGKSIGWICESLQLANALINTPRIRKLADRQSAINFLHPDKPYLPNETCVTVYSGLGTICGKIVGRGSVGSKEVYLIETTTWLFASYFRSNIIAARSEQVKEV